MDNDDFDGVLFRFWIHAASYYPCQTAKAISGCLTPEDYRTALLALARERRVNLPDARAAIEGEKK